MRFEYTRYKNITRFSESYKVKVLKVPYNKYNMHAENVASHGSEHLY